MKFGKITAENVSRDAISLGGAVIGGALSGGAMTFVPEKQALLARGGMTAVSLLGAASLKGKTTTENLVRFALLGVGITQGAQLVKHFASQHIAVDANSSAGEKFLAGAMGLACPCGVNSPALASPVIDFPALMTPGTSGYDAYQEAETEDQTAAFI